MSRSLELLDEMQQKEREADSLRHQLRMSLQIQELWPAAFEHGSVQASLHGDFHQPLELQLRIRRGNVDEKYFPLANVPKELRDFHIDRHLEAQRGHLSMTPATENRWKKALEKWDAE